MTKKKQTKTNKSKKVSSNVKKSDKPELEDLYKDDKKEIIMDKLEQGVRGNKGRVALIVILSLVVVVLLGAVAYYFWTNYSKIDQNNQDVLLSLTMSDKITSGDVMDVTLEIIAGEVDIQEAEVVFDLPVGFYVHDSSLVPVNTEGSIFGINNLAANTTTKIIISGSLVGLVGEFKEFGAEMIYEPANFSSEFSKSVKQTTLINATNLALDVTLSAKATSDQEILYKVEATNTSDQELNNIRLIFVLPENFKITSDDLSLQRDFESLAKGESIEVEINGKIIDPEVLEQEFVVQIGVIDEETSSFILQQEEGSTVLVINPELNLTMSINQDETDEYFAQADENLNFKLVVANPSDVLLKNIDLELEFLGTSLTDPDNIIMYELLENEYDVDIVDNKIIFESANISELRSLKPNSTLELDFVLPVQETFIPTDGSELYVEATASITAAEFEGFSEGVEVEFPVVKKTIFIKTGFTTLVEARMYNDNYQKVGSGPNPPRVAEKTTYRVYLNINNTTNSIIGGLATLVLPSDVIWEDSYDVENASSFSYDLATNIIQWSLGEVPAYSDDIFGWFDISLTPTQSQEGKILDLVDSITLSGLDNLTQEQLSSQIGPITTELIGDEAAAGSGKVLPALVELNSNTNINSSSL